MASHAKFIGRTVLVKNNDLDTALFVLQKIMKRDNLLTLIRRRQAGMEKPYEERQRRNYERSKRLYLAELDKKLKLAMRKDRPNPWLC